MIIDCHGHYTTSPPQLQTYRDGQIAGAGDPSYVPARGNLGITDDEIRQSLEGAQLKIQRERGTGMTVFSPRAMGMGHHVGNAVVFFASNATPTTGASLPVDGGVVEAFPR